MNLFEEFCFKKNIAIDVQIGATADIDNGFFKNPISTVTSSINLFEKQENSGCGINSIVFIRKYPFSTYTKFSIKLTYLTL